MEDKRATTGVTGLDQVLLGGWPAGRMFLVQGNPGTGKTTLGIEFLLAASADERCLYISLSETEGEIRAVCAAHGWSLEGIDLFDLDQAEQALGLGDAQTMFHPSDVEFRATTQAIVAAVERVRPSRLVFDSLSELALLARDPLGFRRELLMFKRLTMDMGCTTILMSDQTGPETDRQLHSLAHGVLELEDQTPEYGPSRRRLRVRKLRGSDYGDGYHDFIIETGGIEVYPRLVAADHDDRAVETPLATGVVELDKILGGGLARGASTLLMGPAGTGKSNLLAQFASATTGGGEPAALFLFDEELDSFLLRAECLGMPLRQHVTSGLLELHQIDARQLSPGQFTQLVYKAVSERGARLIGIDSLNGYLHAMPEERYLTAQMHELLSYLAKSGVITCMVLTQSGLIADMKSPADITYVADSVLLTRFFEASGEVRRALSMLKKRSGRHETTIREITFVDGLQLGPPLRDFQGVLSGVPEFVGDSATLLESSPSDVR